MPEAVDRLRRLGGTQVVAKIDVDGVALHAAGDPVGQMGKASARFGGRLTGWWQSLHRMCTRFHSISLCSHLAVCPSRIRPVALICAKHPSQTQL